MNYHERFYNDMQRMPYKSSITTITSYVYVSSIIDINRLKAQILNKKIFHNSVHIKHPQGFGIKIFRTGIHITGCKRFEQIDEIISYVNSILDDKLEVLRIDIQLVNMMFDVENFVCLESLWKVATTQGFVAHYDRETYAGIKIKINEATVLGFSSGKFMICGLKKHHDLWEIFQTFYTMYEKNKQRILM